MKVQDFAKLAVVTSVVVVVVGLLVYSVVKVTQPGGLDCLGIARATLILCC